MSSHDAKTLAGSEKSDSSSTPHNHPLVCELLPINYFIFYPAQVQGQTHDLTQRLELGLTWSPHIHSMSYSLTDDDLFSD